MKNIPRLKEIGRYINTTEAAFPNSIILAANYSSKSGLVVEEEALRWRIEPLSEDNDELVHLVIPSPEPTCTDYRWPT